MKAQILDIGALEDLTTLKLVSFGKQLFISHVSDGMCNLGPLFPKCEMLSEDICSLLLGGAVANHEILVLKAFEHPLKVDPVGPT